MRTKLVLLAFLLAACKGRALDVPQDIAPPSSDLAPPSSDLAPPTDQRTLSGFTLDIDALTDYHASHPDASAAELVASACIPNTPVYAMYEDGTSTETVLADDMCRFTLSASYAYTVHLVVKQNAEKHLLQTYSMNGVVISATGASNMPAFGYSTGPASRVAGIATALGTDLSTLVKNGICMFNTTTPYSSPFITFAASQVQSTQPSSFAVYAETDPSTLPPTFLPSDDSAYGTYGVYDPMNTARATVVMDATTEDGMLAYSPTPCDVIPGYVTYAEVLVNDGF